MRALTADQMREADARASERVGAVALMRAAGEVLAEAIRAHAPDARRLVAFAGPGNNGGDAFAAFAELDAAYERTVYAAESHEPSDARRDAEQRAHRSGGISAAFPTTLDAALEALDGADLALDALLGTGARAEPKEAFHPAIDALNAAVLPVLAVDIPTGVDATRGVTSRHTVRASFTVTLGALKYGLLVDRARDYAGALYLGDIGIGGDVTALDGPRFEVLDERAFLELVPRRADDSEKRSAGAPLVVAGSAQFPGAAVLCARGAARAGAGYVTVATTDEAAATLRTHLVEQVVMTWSERDPASAIDELLGLTRHCNSVGIGPGLGLSDATGTIVRGFIERLTLPFVADASALFHFAKHLDLLRGKRCVITPHEGEFARLSGEGTVMPGTRLERLRAFVGRTGVTTLLKGRATLVDDGATVHVNTTGTNALATAGTGDVLTGMIATLLAQGLAPVDAARAAAYWHGRAGQLAHARRRVGVIAGDLPELLAEALPSDDILHHPPGRLTRVF